MTTKVSNHIEDHYGSEARFPIPQQLPRRRIVGRMLEIIANIAAQFSPITSKTFHCIVLIDHAHAPVSADVVRLPMLKCVVLLNRG